MNEMIQKIVTTLYDKKAQDITVLHVGHLTVITDYMVIATGRSALQVKALADRVYDNRNMAAQAASGSSCADAMVIAPCSMKTLAGIAMGYDDSLLVRAADVMLKERRRLILLTRETPLNLSHIRNMETVTLMGGIILPPVPAFYSRPQTVDDIVDQTVSRTLRLLGLDGGERFRWNGNG